MMKAGLVGFILIATSAFASPPGSRGPDNDPDEVVCVQQKEIGSRLSSRRICRTRAEWREHQAQARQVTERVQMNRPTLCRPSDNDPCL